MTDDLIIQARAAELIRAGQHRVKTRKLCIVVAAVAFSVGLLAGMAMPFDIRAVHDYHVPHLAPAVQPAHQQPSEKP